MQSAIYPPALLNHLGLAPSAALFPLTFYYGHCGFIVPSAALGTVSGGKEVTHKLTNLEPSAYQWTTGTYSC